jgi:hypothetical protein
MPFQNSSLSGATTESTLMSKAIPQAAEGSGGFRCPTGHRRPCARSGMRAEDEVGTLTIEATLVAPTRP